MVEGFRGTDTLRLQLQLVWSRYCTCYWKHPSTIRCNLRWSYTQNEAGLCGSLIYTTSTAEFTLRLVICGTRCVESLCLFQPYGRYSRLILGRGEVEINVMQHESFVVGQHYHKNLTMANNHRLMSPYGPASSMGGYSCIPLFVENTTEMTQSTHIMAMDPYSKNSRALIGRPVSPWQLRR